MTWIDKALKKIGLQKIGAQPQNKDRNQMIWEAMLASVTGATAQWFNGIGTAQVAIDLVDAYESAIKQEGGEE